MAGPITSDNWRDFAECREGNGHDAELWFPVGTAGPALLQTTAAKKVCNDHCVARFHCLVWALRTGQEFGIAGGFDEYERRRLRQRKHLRDQVLAEAVACAELIESEQVAS